MNLDFSRSCAFVFVVATALGSSACTTSRYRDARYTPAPIELEVASSAVAGSQVRALATVLGIARADSRAGHGEQVEVRLRLENLGNVAARLETDSLSLVSADLVPFAAAVVAPGVDTAVPPGENRTIDVAFPVSAAERDWNGMNLRFALSFGDARATAGATFQRVVYPTCPYPEPVQWHFGIHYGHHW